MQRIDLKRLLASWKRRALWQKPRAVPRARAICRRWPLLQVLKPDAAGDLFAEAVEEGVDNDAGADSDHPEEGRSGAWREGDRILARLARVDLDDYAYEARLIRQLGSNPLKVLGIFRKGSEGGRIVPIDKGQDKEWRVAARCRHGGPRWRVGRGRSSRRRRMGLPQARITARLGDPSGPRAVSLIAIHQHGIPDQFPDAVIAEADAAAPGDLGQPRGPARPAIW